MKAGAVFAAALAGSAMADSNIESRQEMKAFGPSELKAASAPMAVSMKVLREKKVKQHEQDRADGVYDEDRYKLQAATSCVDGKSGEYACNQIDLKGFLRHQDLNSRTREGNDVWGWTAPNGREFGIVGQTDGTAFVEVEKDGSLSYVGRLGTQTVESLWRDVKVVGNYAYIGSEAPNHGMQVFNLNNLLKVDKSNPPTFRTSTGSDTGLTALFSGFGSSHNLVANEDTQTVFAVGTDTSLDCRGGLWMIDVSNPNRPQDNGCVSSDGYVHDAQCILYKGPQTAYRGKEICFNYNEDALTIVDISRRAMPRQLSRTTYNGATYTHQGWTATDDHRYLLLDDELDEQEGNGPAADGHTATYIVDITDLTFPVFRGVYKSPVKSIDHNQYIIDGIAYQSNYGSGLRMVNVSSITDDDSGAKFEEIAYFDVHPEDDEQGGAVTFNGAWSVYPYFQSGYLLVNSIERGIYSLKHNPQ